MIDEVPEDASVAAPSVAASWVPRRAVRVELALYPVRVLEAGGVEVLIAGRWRAQKLFQVYDDASLQTVVEIMVRRYRALR